MESGDDFQRLKAENEQLTIQLLDLDALISAREDELEMLRKMAEEGRRLKSNLDSGFHEMEQMRQALEEARLKTEGIENFCGEMERELLESLQNEKKHLELLEKSGSLSAEVEVLQNELSDIKVFNEKIQYLEGKVAELSSRLEIAELDRDSLKQELEAFRDLRFRKPEINDNNSPFE